MDSEVMTERGEDDVESVADPLTHDLLASEIGTKSTKEWPEVPLGVTYAMSNDEYHGDRSAVSSTQLKRMLTSPAHFIAGMSQPDESTAAMRYGTVLHARILEPETFDERFYSMPTVLKKNTKAGRAVVETIKAAASGRTIYPAAWDEGFDRIMESLQAHRRAQSILSEGCAEVALSWVDPETGIKLKVKLDWVTKGFAMVADVKSARDATLEGFGAAAARLEYPLSAFMYCEAVKQVMGVLPTWAFISCESSAPYSVAVYRADAACMRRGEVKFRTALRRLAKCRESGKYPGLQAEGEWEDLDLPRWY